MCLGVARHANTAMLFQTAEQLNCQYIYDNEFESVNLSKITTKIQHFITEMDALYVTIDLDVFSSQIAHGSSAPVVRRIDLSTFEIVFQ